MSGGQYVVTAWNCCSLCTSLPSWTSFAPRPRLVIVVCVHRKQMLPLIMGLVFVELCMKKLGLETGANSEQSSRNSVSENWKWWEISLVPRSKRQAHSQGTRLNRI